MKLTQGVHLCGSGAFGLTSDGDCHCYVLDGGSELALIDCGLSENPEAILSRLEEDGLDTGRLKYLLPTRIMPMDVHGFRRIWESRSWQAYLKHRCWKGDCWKH